MKKLVLLSVLVVAVATPDVAAVSLDFSTEMGYQSWTVTAYQGSVDISFDHLVVEYSDPAGDPVVGDTLDLPGMAFSNIIVDYSPVFGNYIMADLTPFPGQQLTITDDISGLDVMTADVGSSFGFFVENGPWLAYPNPDSDLSNIATDHPGYSAVIDDFVATDAEGLAVDLSLYASIGFGLYQLLEDFYYDNSTVGSVSGALDGQISPEPCTMLLLGFGSLVLLRKRGALNPPKERR